MDGPLEAYDKHVLTNDDTLTALTADAADADLILTDDDMNLSEDLDFILSDIIMNDPAQHAHVRQYTAQHTAQHAIGYNSTHNGTHNSNSTHISTHNSNSIAVVPKQEYNLHQYNNLHQHPEAAAALPPALPPRPTSNTIAAATAKTSFTTAATTSTTSTMHTAQQHSTAQNTSQHHSYNFFPFKPLPVALAPKAKTLATLFPSLTRLQKTGKQSSATSWKRLNKSKVRRKHI